MKCKWNQCTNEARLKSPFCGDTCYKRWKRDSKSSEDGSGSTNSDKTVLNHHPTRTSNSDKCKSDNEVGQAAKGMERMGFKKCEVGHADSTVMVSVLPDKPTRPPCTADQLTSSCLTCKDKPTCSYLANMNSAVPGDVDYAGVI